MYIFAPFLTALIITFIVTPISIIVLKRMDIYDDPKQHKHPAILHKKPIPRGGGIPLFLGIAGSMLLFLGVSPLTTPLFLASLIALAIGILDDKFDLSPYLRLIGNFLCASIVVGSAVTIPFITNPLGGILHLETLKISYPLFGIYEFAVIPSAIAIIWIMWVMNMLNWSSGVDGQMSGVVAISAVTIGILSLRFSELDQQSLLSAKLSFIIAGSALGFLPFHFYPAKIFPGYGATSVYLLLAVVSILSGAKLATAILVMGVPMVDGIFTILRRILAGRSPFWHDKKHLHHLLLRLGFSQQFIALSYWTFSAILGIISLTLSSKGKLFAMIMLLVIVGGGILFLNVVTRSKDEKTHL